MYMTNIWNSWSMLIYRKMKTRLYVSRLSWTHVVGFSFKDHIHKRCGNFCNPHGELCGFVWSWCGMHTAPHFQISNPHNRVQIQAPCGTFHIIPHCSAEVEFADVVKSCGCGEELAQSPRESTIDSHDSAFRDFKSRRFQSHPHTVWRFPQMFNWSVWLWYVAPETKNVHPRNTTVGANARR